MGALQALVAVIAMGVPIVTQAWNGRTVELDRGRMARLRLSEHWRWTTPRVAGDTVKLVRVDYEVDPGYREWEIRAVARGTSTIRATRMPGAVRFVVTIRVR